MSVHTLTASHAAGKGGPDAVFAVSQKANEAIARLGKEKVVNASIGAIFDDEGRFAALDTVDRHYRRLPKDELMNYAPIAGLPQYLQAAIDFTFQGNQPAGTFARAVATPGGTGAIHHVVYNYTEQGQKILIPDWYWGPYQTIANENLRDVEAYQMFNEKNQFTLDALKKKTQELLQVQDNLVTIFNTPAHNPTGYSMTEEDWQDAIRFYKECARDQSKKIVLLLDMAYLDYAGPAQETRKFLKLFTGLPDNILITIAFSMSKAFLIYGMRSGALIGVSPSQEIAEEFAQVNAYSNRATWSNGSRGAQRLLADIMADPQLKRQTDEERDKFYSLIKNRADIFVREAKEAGLVMLPYHAGFFITIPVGDPKAAAEKLAGSNIFVVPLKKGIRLAVCALPTYQIPGLAKRIKEAL